MAVRRAWTDEAVFRRAASRCETQVARLLLFGRDATAGAWGSPRIEVREPSSGSPASPKRLRCARGKLHSAGLGCLPERR